MKKHKKEPKKEIKREMKHEEEEIKMHRTFGKRDKEELKKLKKEYRV